MLKCLPDRQAALVKIKTFLFPIDIFLKVWYNIITGMRNTNRLKGVSTMKKSMTKYSRRGYAYITKKQAHKRIRRARII